MRLNGAQRTPLTDRATEVLWWNENTLLVWSPEHQAAFLSDNQLMSVENSQGAISIQPGGLWALKLRYNGEDFQRVLVHLENPDQAPLALGTEYPNLRSSAWSPDGKWLAYVALDSDARAQIFRADPQTGQIVQWTHLAAGGEISGLNWSPDGNKLAFWVTPLTKDEAGEGRIHVVDVPTGELVRYCGFAVTENQVNLPRLIWSPDAKHIAFKMNPEDDGRGYLLVALDVESGVYIELSDGIYPGAEVIAWGKLST
jgi:Tol biopolymer transport system component